MNDTSEIKPVIRRLFLFTAMFAMVNVAFQFGEVIARKSLAATPLQVTILTMMFPMTSIISIWVGRYLSGRDQRPLIRVTGTIAVAALASGLLLTTYWHLFGIFLVFALVSSAQTLAQTRILQQYIPANRTGKMLGMAQGLGMITGAIYSAVGGYWLDHVYHGWQSLFFVTGLLGFIGVLALASIPTRNEDHIDRFHFRRDNFFAPLSEVIALLKRRKDFLRFEMAFMLYGVAFMMQLPVIPLYLVDDLQLHYSDIGLARGTIFQLVMIAGIPFYGRLFDRSTPHRLSMQVFALGALFPLVLLSASLFDGAMQKTVVMIAFGLFGAIMSGVIMLWNLSAMRFAQSGEDVAVYQSVHIAATGVRGAFAPLMGLGITTLFGNRIALAVASLFWIAASVAMIVARKYDVKLGENISLRV
ncbi:MAG: MFS transporter [bacterium]|nr:MFS transporter [bacterium]